MPSPQPNRRSARPFPGRPIPEGCFLYDAILTREINDPRFTASLYNPSNLNILDISVSIMDLEIEKFDVSMTHPEFDFGECPFRNGNRNNIMIQGVIHRSFPE